MSAVLARPPLGNGLSIRKAAVIGVLMAAAAIGSEVWRPTYILADHKPKIVLEDQIPKVFGDWRVDGSIIPILPNPETQAKLDQLYSQTLARTYISRAGQRVMLSIAYGSDQGSEATAVHRPEFCYSAQGFRVMGRDGAVLQLPGVEVPAARLVGQMGARVEPITYWITLDEQATLPGWGRKLQQLRFGVQGQVPDGMLVRVSTISSDEQGSYAIQQEFLTQLVLAVPENVRARYFGSKRTPH